MVSERRIAAAATPLASFVVGIACTAALKSSLYATTALGLLVLGWLVLRAMLVIRPPLPPAPLPNSDTVAEHRRLTAYLDLSPAPLILLGPTRRPEAVNRAARRLLVRQPANDDILADAIAAADPGRSASVRIETDAGPHTFALVTTDVTTAGTGGRVAALIDIEADLRAAEAATLRDLLQVLSHEITNTLTPIASLGRLAAQMLADPEPDHIAVADAVETVARRAEALQRFAAAYRAMARLPAPALRPVDLAALLTDQARLFAIRWPGATLDFTPPIASSFRGDPDQLSQAFWALLQNAAEASERVMLTVRTTPRHLVVEIADNGPGVPPGEPDAIFRPFFTTKPDGSGVGLPLARQIARAHGGDLTLADGVSPGACFLLSLPRSD